jgi:hypothetical protein
MISSECRSHSSLVSPQAVMPFAVSIDGAAPPPPWRQKSNSATISSSRSTPGYTPVSARSRSSRKTASPASVSVPRSPPEPLTHSSRVGSPVTGSTASPLAEVLPPA